jgi:hypothetical protein
LIFFLVGELPEAEYDFCEHFCDINPLGGEDDFKVCGRIKVVLAPAGFNAARRISSNLKASSNQFGWLQAPAPASLRRQQPCYDLVACLAHKQTQFALVNNRVFCLAQTHA